MRYDLDEKSGIRTAMTFAILGLLVSLLSTGGSWGCEEEGESGGEASEESAEATSEAPVDPAAQLREENPYVAFVAELSPKLRPELTERAARAEFQDGLEARLRAATRHARRRAKIPAEKRPPRDLHYDETLTTFYTEREFAPVFTERGRLTDASQAAFEIMQDAESHGLAPEDYWVEALTETSEKAAALSDQLVEAPGLELYEREQLGLAAWLEAKEVPLDDPDADKKVFEMLLADGDENPLPRVRGAYDLYRSRQAELLDVAVELEARMADAYTRYVRDMYAGNLNRLSPEEREKYGDEVHPKYHSEIVVARLIAQLGAFAEVEKSSAEAGRQHVESIWPRHAQYKKLLAAYARYRAILEAGGWSTIQPAALNKGGRAPSVRALKERLAAEGYFEGAVDDFFGEDLADAIALYQETHQLEITGEVNRTFWSSVNISAEDRTAEIRVNLERWREAQFFPSDYYVYINVPDFHAELWRDGERIFRTKIVVGNTTRKCDPSTGKWYFPNATPMQHAELTHLIFNPYWNVPHRIEREEYVPEIESDPKWLEENGFEYHRAHDGVVLRQLPGPDNALGKVKFIFPNRHNTYMHDTPKQEFFSWPVRAFSHGCMRVEDPMEMAEVMLDPEGKWDDKKIWGLLKKDDEARIDLDEPIDVFIEYFTVRVDKFQRVHFLADIYDYVYHEIDPPPPGSLRCNPGSEDDSGVPAGADFGP